MNTSRIVSILFAGLTLAGGAALAQRVEENSARLQFQGTWTPANDPNASGGTHTVSNAVGSSVAFDVTGTNFVLYRKVDPNGGYASVTVDGKGFGNLTFYFQEARWQVPAAIDELGAGPHKIVLTVSATNPPGSGGTNVYFDALENPAPAGIQVSAVFGTMAAPSPAQTDAVTRTNFYRAKMGLPLVRHHLALGLAAHAHAKYLSDADFIRTGVDPHRETFGFSPNFTGVQPRDRDAYFGLTAGGGIEDSNNTVDPVTFVDGWMGGVYHLSPTAATGQRM